MPLLYDSYPSTLHNGTGKQFLSNTNNVIIRGQYIVSNSFSNDALLSFQLFNLTGISTNYNIGMSSSWSIKK